MLFKSLFVLAILVTSCSAAGRKFFRIKSEQYGYVCRNGNLSDYLLEFSTTDEPALFRSTRGKVLQHVITGKYVNRISLIEPLLILADKRSRRVPRWIYNSTNQHLRDVADPQRRCFSAWPLASIGGQDPYYVAGESLCGGKNKLILEEVVPSNSSVRIKAAGYGYVSRYGNLSGHDVLEFSFFRQPDLFRFTSGYVLQHVTTGKYVNRLSLTDPLLILADKRSRGVPRWIYISADQHLKDVADPRRRCFSPRAIMGQVPQYLAGESRCSGWNKLVFEPALLDNMLS